MRAYLKSVSVSRTLLALVVDDICVAMEGDVCRDRDFALMYGPVEYEEGYIPSRWTKEMLEFARDRFNRSWWQRFKERHF